MRELFDRLERPVELHVAHGPEETPLPGARDVDFGAETERVVAGLAELSRHLSYRVDTEPAGFERYPAVAVLPEGRDAGVRYYGLPWGYELGSLIGAVVEAGRAESSLKARLARAPRRRSTAISRSTSSSRRPDRIARRPCCWRTKRRSPHLASAPRRSSRRSFPRSPIRWTRGPAAEDRRQRRAAVGRLRTRSGSSSTECSLRPSNDERG